jgi:hypothetical protein
MKAYLDRMCRSGLNELLDGNDYAAIVEAINAVPHLSDEYLAKLAEDHNKVSVGKDYFAHFSNRFLEYQNISKQLSVSIEYWYYSTWQVNPNVLNNSMLALEAWINNDLEHVASIIDAADKNIDGKSTLAKHGLNFANQALMEIANANIPPTNHLQANVIPKLTEQNLDLVRELNKYLRYRGQSFDVDYVSKSNADLSALQAGDWKKAAAGIQPDDVSVNLTLPIAILADYAKRSPNDAFKADLELIFARLEGLRDRASKIVNQ